MLYLLDGYNLLHAMGVLPAGRVGPTGLERARLNLLGILHGAFGPEASHVTVIFDAANPPPDLPAQYEFHGIQVIFAVEQKEADDLIEYHIEKASAPKNLTVVSDDHRIQQAGRRRHCIVPGCQEFLEWLQKKRHRQKPKPASAKPQGVSGAETQYWLKEFADLAEEPDMKELFDPYGFLEKEGED